MLRAVSPPSSPLVIARSAIPFFIAPTGTMANNGAITLGTALPTTYANAYIFLPAGAIAAGVPAASTWYFCQMSSTTVGAVFNNIYVSGLPTVPASPTAFATTGPGAYTGITAATTGPQITIPAGALGPNGVLRTSFLNSVAATINAKTITYTVGGQTLIATALNTASQFGTSQVCTTYNRGVQNSNATTNSSTTGGTGVQPSAGTHYTSIDFSQAQSLSVGGTLAVATDFIVMEAFAVEVMQG